MFLSGQPTVTATKKKKKYVYKTHMNFHLFNEMEQHQNPQNEKNQKLYKIFNNKHKQVFTKKVKDKQKPIKI